MEVGNSQLPVKAKMSLIALFIGMMLLLGILTSKKKIWCVIICIMFLIPLSFCEIDILKPPESSKIKHSYTVENLNSNSTYFWKVVAIGEKGIDSESLVRSFETGE